MGLKFAIVITFFILGVLLWSVFWAAMWFLNVSGAGMIYATFAFVGLMIFAQWLIGPAILKRLTRMQPCTDKKILSMVHGIADAAKIPRPMVYIVDDPTPNAFAFGRTQGSSNIAIHKGLLEKLNDDEVRGVVAHEIGHIANRDMLVMTLASALPVLLYYIVYFGTIFASSRNEKGGGVNYLGAFIGGMVAQFLSMLLVLYLSRVREYSADAYSAQATKRPKALASALAKITYSLAQQKPKAVPTNLRTFYIADPVQSVSSEYRGGMEAEKSKGVLEIFLTHPLTRKRILELERMEKEFKTS